MNLSCRCQSMEIYQQNKYCDDLHTNPEMETMIMINVEKIEIAMRILIAIQISFTCVRTVHGNRTKLLFIFL